MPRKPYNHNRKARRERQQKLREAGLTKTEAKFMIERLSSKTRNPISCWEGEKVKIDFERIYHYKDYEKLNPKYKEFIENNRSTVFTVEFDPYRKQHNTKDKENMVQLVEDESVPKWLFWAGDLIPLPGQKRPLTTKDLFLERVDAVIDSIVAKETGGTPPINVNDGNNSNESESESNANAGQRKSSERNHERSSSLNHRGGTKNRNTNNRAKDLERGLSRTKREKRDGEGRGKD